MSLYSNKRTNSASDVELQKMVRGFRVSDLHSLLSYAGRYKGGKKSDLQNRALDLIKLHSVSIEMKIRELHMNRYQQNNQRHLDPQDLYPMGAMSAALGGGGPYRAPPAHQGSIGNALPSYVQSMNKQMLRNVNPVNIPSYAVNPDVKFKDLPFYDVLYELMRPTSLVPVINERAHERELVFYLTPQQLLEIEQSCDVQVQLRFCLLETSCEQDDEFPSQVQLKVNNHFATLPNPIPTNKPGLEPKRPRRPVDITNVTKLTSIEGNRVTISWSSTNGRPYVVAVFLVRKQSASVLIRRLKANGVRNPDHTTAMIKEKLCQDRDSEIATMSLRGSLMCPLGKIKMKLPCRALTCTHLQCFDATLYVQMNEKKPKWICPVCDKPAYFKNLAIDGLFLDIVSKAPFECTEVQFHEDGSWTPVMPVKKTTEINDSSFEVVPKKELAPKPKKPSTVEVISLDSDSETEESWPVLPPKKKPCSRPVGIIAPVHLESSENTQPVDVTRKPFDSFAPSVSKTVTDMTGSDSVIPNKNESVKQIIGLESEDTFILPTSPIKAPLSPFAPTSSQVLDQPPTTSSFNDSLEILDSAPTFDYYSLINNTQEFNFPTESYPDVISIDD